MTNSNFLFSAVHEKIFITFMISSLSYMLTTLKVYKMVHPVMDENQQYSFKLKKSLFVTSILSTVGLFVFFLKHRFLCHDMGKFNLTDKIGKNKILSPHSGAYRDLYRSLQSKCR